MIAGVVGSVTGDSSTVMGLELGCFIGDYVISRNDFDNKSHENII
jgi:hypothetical protein